MGSINVSASAKMIIASPLRLIQDFTVTPGKRKNFDQMPHNGQNHAGLEPQKYFQPWAIYDTTEVQFLSNHDSHTAEIINCETGDSTSMAVSLKKSYRGKYFRATCRAKSLNGKLFIYFEEGIYYSDEDFLVEDSEFDFQKRPPEAPQIFTNPSTGISIQQWKYINLLGGEALRLKIDFLHADFVTSVVVPSSGSGYTYDSESNALGILTDIDVELTEENGLIEIVYNEKEHDLYSFTVNFNLDPGDYYVQLTCSTASQSEVFKTEGLRVIDNDSPEYKETVLFEVMHTGEFDSDDYFGFVYSGLNKIRLAAAQFYSFDPSGDINVFEGDTGVATKTRAVPHRLLNFHLENIPNWLSDKLNVLFSHDTIEVGGYRYEVTEYGSADHMEGNDIQHYDVVLRQVSDRKVAESNGVSTELTAVFNPNERLNVIAAGGGGNHVLETNVDGDFELANKPDWITVDEETRQDGQTLAITALENTAQTQREGVISYRSANYPTLLAEISVSQVAAEVVEEDYLITNPVDTSLLEFDTNGEYFEITVNASGAYDYEKTGSTSFIVTNPSANVHRITANKATSERTGSIRFYLLSDGTVDSEISLHQDPPPGLVSVTPDNVQFDRKGGAALIDIQAESACNWQVLKPLSATWVSFSKISGTGDDTISVIASANPGGTRAVSCVIRNIDNGSDVLNFSVTQTATLLTDPL